MLKHPGSETISNLEKSVINVKIIEPESVPLTNECEACALIKAHKLIFRRPGHDESADASFARTRFDPIQQNITYNGDN